MTSSDPVPLAAIEAARAAIAPYALRTPLVPYAGEDAPAELHLKLETLQPIGSFKLRGAAAALARASDDELARGVFTASAGNMAQGVGWVARVRGLPFDVVVPDHAPRTKLDAIARLGGRVHPVPFDAWWRVIETHRHPGLDGLFVHPVCDEGVMAGNGTIGLELLEDLPRLDAVVVPYQSVAKVLSFVVVLGRFRPRRQIAGESVDSLRSGNEELGRPSAAADGKTFATGCYGGGGLISGVASALRARRPGVRVYAAEVETAAPLSAALEAGRPVEAPWRASFVDGIGGRSVLEAMWPRVRALVDGTIVVTLDEVAAAIRALASRHRVVAEGAGAAALAAALTGRAGDGVVACVVSGGNLDADVLARVLTGETP